VTGKYKAEWSKEIGDGLIDNMLDDSGVRMVRNAVLGGTDVGGWLTMDPARKTGQSARANSMPSRTKSNPASQAE
jgi:hypothetical protein